MNFCKDISLPALNVKHTHRNKKQIERFFKYAKSIGCRCIYFTPVDRSEENLFKNRVNQRVQEFLIENKLDALVKIHSMMLKVLEQIEEHEGELADYIEELPRKVDHKTLEGVKKFFERVKKPLGNKPDGTQVNPIPEEEDMVVLSRAISLDQYSERFILSGDRHFTEYSEEIVNEYNIHIINENKLSEYLSPIC